MGKKRKRIKRGIVEEKEGERGEIERDDAVGELDGENEMGKEEKKWGRVRD